MKRILLIAITVMVVAGLFSRCAKIVTPQGGPKDETPPVMEKSSPGLYSTNFDGKKVVMTFDEFIQIPGIGQKLIVSPPQEETPKISLKGKRLELVFKEDLIENTTYTLYFSDAIADNNEGNKIPNFEFAFSTGPVIDSLTFSGKLIDAYTLEPQEGILIMLYDSMEDSLPLTKRPLYVTKSNSTGDFMLSNLKESDFKIFALGDMNSNYLFDQITEAIAFSKDTVKKSMLVPRLRNPLQKETGEEKEKLTSGKTVKPDSTLLGKVQKPLELRLFTEENRVHSLVDFSRDSRRRLRVIFTRKPEKEVLISPLGRNDMAKSWYEKEVNLTGDTIAFWITDPAINKRDTLLMRVTYMKTDSAMNMAATTDTLRFFFADTEKPDTRQRRRGSAEAEKPPSLPINLSFPSGSTPGPTEPLRLRFNMPLIGIDTAKIFLENRTDSTLIPGIKLSKDSINPRFYYLNYTWEPNISYLFTAMPRAFINLDSLANDTTTFAFIGADPERYGKLNVKLDSTITPNIIIDLLNEKGVQVKRKIARTNSVVTFDFVAPGKYYFRFIHDTNRNDKWDTGWYKEGIQPEKVVVLKEGDVPKIFNVRANWEYDVEYNLEMKNN